jgi:hypothetical protein
MSAQNTNPLSSASQSGITPHKRASVGCRATRLRVVQPASIKGNGSLRRSVVRIYAADDHAMIAVLLGCGLWGAEVAGLIVEDIEQREDHWVVVRQRRPRANGARPDMGQGRRGPLVDRGRYLNGCDLSGDQ